MTGALPRVTILGGGIAGLAAAWECRRLGLTATVLERQARAGRFVLDAGPDAFLVSKPGAIELCRELGIDDRLITMESPRGAYVLRDGELHALPEGGAFGVATRVGPFLASTLLSPFGKLRTALEVVTPARRTSEDESAGAFFRRRFGSEFAQRVAQPLLGGIHAGDLDQLSARAVIPQLVAMERDGRSVLLSLRAQGRRPREGGAFRSFRDGMVTLVDQLVAHLPADTIRLGDGADTVTRTPHGWRVVTHSGVTTDSELIVLASPAPVVAEWLRPLSTPAADVAAGIRYVSSAGVLSAYRTEDIARPLRGSGYVSARDGSERLIATSWLTGKWAGRAPVGFTLLRGFYGGAYDEAVMDWSDDALVDDAHMSWARRFGIGNRPSFSRVVRWSRTSPQHEVGHLARIATVDGALAALGGIAVAGSGFRAVGIPDVVTDARQVVRRLLDVWRAR